MSFLKSLISPLTEAAEEANRLAEVAKWTEMFNNFFGSPEPENFKKGDEGFYHLLTLNQHGAVVAKMIEAPVLFCRAKIIAAFFLGESSEVVDGKRQERRYPKATGEVASTAAEAISPLLAERLQEVMRRHVGGVNRWFWVTDPKHTEYKVGQTGGADAQTASGLMHSLLNIADGVGDAEAKKELATWFRKAFGNLPSGIYHRLAGHGNRHELVSACHPVRRKGAVRQTDGKAADFRPTPADEAALAAYNAAKSKPPANNPRFIQ